MTESDHAAVYGKSDKHLKQSEEKFSGTRKESAAQLRLVSYLLLRYGK